MKKTLKLELICKLGIKFLYSKIWPRGMGGKIHVYWNF
jgi:hypothetical protein